MMSGPYVMGSEASALWRPAIKLRSRCNGSKAAPRRIVHMVHRHLATQPPPRSGRRRAIASEPQVSDVGDGPAEGECGRGNSGSSDGADSP
jgi:hypothetical protein